MVSILLFALVGALAPLPGLIAVAVSRARGEQSRVRVARWGIACIAVGEVAVGRTWASNALGLAAEVGTPMLMVVLLVPIGNLLLAFAGSTRDSPLLGLYLLGVVLLFIASNIGYTLAVESQTLASVVFMGGAALGTTLWALGGGGALALASALALPRDHPEGAFGAPDLR